MKVTWYKMSEKKPEECQIIFLYDPEDESIEIHIYDSNSPWWKRILDFKWFPIDFPEPPEEEKHQCQWEGFGKKWFCKNIDNELYLWTESAIEAGSINHDNSYLAYTSYSPASWVKFCPHCGKEAK